MRLKDFDPADAFDAMAESIRQQICEIPIEMHKAAIYRELEPHRQIECLMAGMATGVIGVLFAHVQPESRDALMEALTDYLSQARLNAEEILDGHPLKQRRRSLEERG